MSEQYERDRNLWDAIRAVDAKHSDKSHQLELRITAIETQNSTVRRQWNHWPLFVVSVLTLFVGVVAIIAQFWASGGMP